MWSRISATHFDHCPLVGSSGHASKSGITYHMECSYSNRIECPWQCRVFIYFDQKHAAAICHHKYPNAPAVTTEPPDTTCYDRQTMFVVPQDIRNVTHSNHVCVISTAYVHDNHNGFCKNGAHCTSGPTRTTGPTHLRGPAALADCALRRRQLAVPVSTQVLQ
jgi:hypothetical protein